MGSLLVRYVWMYAYESVGLPLLHSRGDRAKRQGCQGVPMNAGKPVGGGGEVGPPVPDGIDAVPRYPGLSRREGRYGIRWIGWVPRDAKGCQGMPMMPRDANDAGGGGGEQVLPYARGWMVFDGVSRRAGVWGLYTR